MRTTINTRDNSYQKKKKNTRDNRRKRNGEMIARRERSQLWIEIEEGGRKEEREFS